MKRSLPLLALSFLAIACSPPATTTSEIDTVLRGAVERGDVAGVVAMAADSDRIIYQGAFGRRFVGADEEMTADSIFRIASMTKAVTSVAAMQLVEEGVVALDRPVASYLPEFAELMVLERLDDASGKLKLHSPSTQATVEQLLSHTAGLGYELFNPLLRDAVASELVPSLFEPNDDFLAAPLVFDPGTQWHYGTNTDWLGRLVENVRGKSLDQVFRDEIFGPLGMEDTHFDLPEEKVRRLATLHSRLQDGSLLETERVAPPPVTFYSGGGGLCSTAGDYIRFLRSLLRGGELDGVRILQAETVDLMGKNHIGDLEAGAMQTAMPQLSNDFDFFTGSKDQFGLGFLINTEPISGGRASGSLAWAGLFNTYFWIDREQDICGVVMTQVLPFYDQQVISLLEEFERAVYSHGHR